MAWWQIVLIVIGAVVIGLGTGYLLNNLIIRTFSALKRTKKRPVRQAAPQPPSTDSEVPIPDLYVEIEFNHRLATKERAGELQSFQTRAWDNRGDEVYSLPVEVRNELAEAYSDMALANSITWLSTEMSRRSPSLDESYDKLRSSVAERLNRVRFQLIEAGSASKDGMPE